MKENTVAVIYHCKNPIQDRAKLQRRLQHAIEDMTEDGFTNFLLPLDERSQFPSIFINAIIAEKARNSHIRLTIMLPYEIERCFAVTPAERFKAYIQYADEIIYNEKEYDPYTFPSLVDNLLEKSSALIIYYERYSTQFSRVTHYAQINRQPFININ